MPSVAERFAAKTSDTPNLRRHVVPLLARLGCSAAACHGAKEGQAGFELSLFGYDYDADLAELADEGDSPRANWKAPLESLILLKPTLQEEHEGGKHFEANGWEYRLLLCWVQARAPGLTPAEEGVSLSHLEIQPNEFLITDPAEKRSVKVIAYWSDGTAEDVTPLSRYQANDQAIAEITPEGELSVVGAGDTHVVAFYDKAIATASLYVPRSPIGGAAPQRDVNDDSIDRYVEEKLAILAIPSSDDASDAEFLRRLSLDVTGTLPTAEEAKQFLASDRADKRAAKIDELLASPEYARWWTTWLCDLTGNGEPFMPNPALRREQSTQWYDWIYRRVHGNTPYDQLVQGLVVAESRSAEESYQAYCERMTAYVRSEAPREFAEQESMPYFWARSNLRSADHKTLAFSHAFLGVQIQCAECHKHPFDRWTRDDFNGLREFFKPLKYGRAADADADYQRMSASLAVPKGLGQGQYYAQLARSGQVAPWEELYYDAPQPSSLSRSSPDAEADGTKPLRTLMEWMRGLDHPYLALAFVNRVWHHYFGVGIVEPPDDLSLANPPSNQALLDALTVRFVESGYDMKRLHREILSSRAYQRSWRPTESNADDDRNFSHAKLRRLPAEVLYDAIWTATAADQGQAIHSQERAIGASTGLTTSDPRTTLLRSLGKPAREAVCERERSDEPNLSQALFLQNDPVIYEMLDRPGGWISLIQHDLARATGVKIDAYVAEAFLRTMTREPNEAELIRCRAFVNNAETRAEGLRGLLWALINSKEFCLN